MAKLSENTWLHIIAITTGSLLALLFFCTLRSIRNGSKYKKISDICLLFFLTSVTLIICAFLQSKWISGSEPSDAIVYTLGFITSINGALYCQSYLNLAWMYKEVSTEVPIILKDEIVT
jgi:hypothetical protein